jgi:hypothetical protein
MRQSQRFAILALIFSLLFSDFVIISGLSKGYELSIYDSIGYAVWFLAIGSIFFSFLSIASAISDTQKSRHEFIIFIALSILIFTITVLPYLRGYVSLDRHDVLTHMGTVMQMVDTGTIWSDNIYPGLHIIASELYLLGGFTSFNYYMTIIPFFAVLLLSGSYCLGKTLFRDRSVGMMCLVIASVPSFWMTPEDFVPTGAAFALIPFILFLQLRAYKNKNGREWIAVLSTSLVTLVIFHPQLCLILPFGILIMPLIGWWRRRIDTFASVRNRMKILDYRSALSSISFLLILFVFSRIHLGDFI